MLLHRPAGYRLSHDTLYLPVSPNSKMALGWRHPPRAIFARKSRLDRSLFFQPLVYLPAIETNMSSDLVRRRPLPHGSPFVDGVHGNPEVFGQVTDGPQLLLFRTRIRG
ncbi:hypothetical protein FRAHR75_130018 [Frankia sp. Hr75.2]|nr:hypothetical protein FRAHR75_130018 [Frankia sp. Hr75.2]